MTRNRSPDASSGLPAGVVLRPIGNPLPLGFIGLFVATSAFSSLQLGWIATSQSHTVALAVLVLTVPVQLVASVFGFLGRDPVAGTGMALLAGTWAAAGLATYTSPPGSSSGGLGVVLLAAGVAMLVPAVAAHAKLLAAAVMTLSAARFAVTGIAEIDGAKSWLTTAGWVGVALALLSLYAAMAFELEGTEKRDVLPIGRRGSAAAAVTADDESDVETLSEEPGVRSQL